MNQLRAERLQRAVEDASAGLKLSHGTSKTPRTLRIHWDQNEPTPDEGEVPVWIRDEWSAAELAVKRSGGRGGR